VTRNGIQAIPSRSLIYKQEKLPTQTRQRALHHGMMALT